MKNLRAVTQEIVALELQEIFGLFNKPKVPPQGPGSTEQLPQDTVQTTPTEKFSLLNLKQLKTSKEIRDYARRSLKMLGSPGQARVAYAIDDQRILKVALSDNKTYQNKNEVENSGCLGPKFAVQVFAFHPRYVWVVEELLKPVKAEEMTNRLNVMTKLDSTQMKFRNPQDVQQFFTNLPILFNTDFTVDYEQKFNDLAKKGLQRDAERHLYLLKSKNSWYLEFGSKLKDCQVASWDFHTSNWGIRPSTGDMVLLDLGFSKTSESPEQSFFKEFIDRTIQEELGQEFDIKTLHTLETIEEIQEYCYKTLGHETLNGKSRLTWIIDDHTVIKVVYREKEVYENQNEIKNSRCLGERYAVKVLDYDHEHFYWIIEERVQGYPTAFAVPEFVEKINSILGTEYDDWFPIMTLFFHGSDAEKDELMKNNEWFRGIVHALEQCDVGSHDLHPGNWGIRPSTGELVILDLGF